MTYYRQGIHHQRVSSTPHDTMSLPTRPSAPAGRPASRGQIARRATSIASMAAARGVSHTAARVSPPTQRLRPRSPPHATHNVHSTPEPPLPHTAPGRVRAHASAPARCARRGTRRARRPLARHEVAHDIFQSTCTRDNVRGGTGRHRDPLHCRQPVVDGSGARRIGTRGGRARSRERRAHNTNRTPIEGS